MWKKYRVSAALLLVCLLTGCAGETAEREEIQEEEESGIEIGMTFDSFIIERWQRDRDVFVSAAQELGADVNVQNANGDLEEQISQIEYFIQKGVDAIVVVAIDSNGLSDAVADAHRAGIPVVAYDRLICDADVDLYISFDNEEVGRLMGEHMKEHLSEGGNILQVCGPLADNNVPLVMGGFAEALENSDITIAGTEHADGWLAETGFAVTDAYLSTGEVPDGIMCGNDSIAGQAIRALFNVYLTILLCLAIGILAGVWQGYWIGYVRIPPFITTLGGMFIFRGFGRLVLDSKTVAVQNEAFLNIFTAYIKIPGLDTDERILSPLVVGAIIVVLIFYSTISSRAKKAKKGYRQNSAFSDFGRSAIISVVLMIYCWMLCQYRGISVMLVWVVAICLIYHFITSKTAFGRYFYAVGGNEKATQLSGINTNKVYFLAYTNMGFLAGLCGLLCLARVGSVNGQTGNSFEMDAIGSCFIGGASAYGGSGTIPGVIIGALLLGVINMGMSIMGIGDSWQYVVKGGVLLVAVIFDVVSNRKSGH